MYEEFKGTTVLITGAGKETGIGYGMARKSSYITGQSINVGGGILMEL